MPDAWALKVRKPMSIPLTRSGLTKPELQCKAEGSTNTFHSGFAKPELQCKVQGNTDTFHSGLAIQTYNARLKVVLSTFGDQDIAWMAICLKQALQQQHAAIGFTQS